MSALIYLLVLNIAYAFCLGGIQIRDDANVTRYIYQLEQRISTLESESETKDQKYAAVLSSVLSKIASQTDELMVFKAHQNVTLQQLQETKELLAELRAEKNLSSRNDSVVCHVDTGKTNNNMTDFLRRDVSFEAKMNKPQSTTHSRLLKFGSATKNADGAYNPVTGVFTAPVSGTYQFWFNVFFTRTVNTKQKDANFMIVAGNRTLSSGLSAGLRPTIHQLSRFLTGVHLVTIKKGDVVSFETTLQGTVSGLSTWGGALYHPDLD